MKLIITLQKLNLMVVLQLVLVEQFVTHSLVEVGFIRLCVLQVLLILLFQLVQLAKVNFHK